MNISCCGLLCVLRHDGTPNTSLLLLWRALSMWGNFYSVGHECWRAIHTFFEQPFCRGCCTILSGLVWLMFCRRSPPTGQVHQTAVQLRLRFCAPGSHSVYRNIVYQRRWNAAAAAATTTRSTTTKPGDSEEHHSSHWMLITGGSNKSWSSGTTRFPSAPSFPLPSLSSIPPFPFLWERVWWQQFHNPTRMTCTINCPVPNQPMHISLPAGGGSLIDRADGRPWSDWSPWIRQWCWRLLSIQWVTLSFAETKVWDLGLRTKNRSET